MRRVSSCRQSKMKCVVWCLFLVLLFCALPQGSAAGAMTVELNSAQAAAGDKVTVSGTCLADYWVPVKVLDSSGAIVFFDCVKSGADGAYNCPFVVPETAVGTLCVVVGGDDAIARTVLEITSQGPAAASSTATSTSDTAVTPTLTARASTGETLASVPLTVTGGAEMGAPEVLVTKGEMMSLLGSAVGNGTGRLISCVEVTVVDSAVTGYGVTINADAFEYLARQVDALLTLSAALGSVTVSAQAIDAMADPEQGEVGSVRFGVAKTAAADLSEAAQKRSHGRPVYQFSGTLGGRALAHFGRNDITVCLPYSLNAGEEQGAVVAQTLDEAGTVQTLSGRYHGDSGMVECRLTQLSMIVLGYEAVDFKDVAVQDWYHEAVVFLAARGIVTGTGTGFYEPDETLTRGQFLVMVMRAYGIPAITGYGANFSDAGDTYYTGYLAAAKKYGMTAGVGNNKFAPDKEVSRQEMLTLLYNTLKAIDLQPETVCSVTPADFSDGGQIASWAQAAMRQFVGSGIISGVNGTLRPADMTTRAVMAQVLYTLLAR